MECIHIRCSIAKMQETKTGTTSNARLQCNMCQKYNKDNKKLEEIEKKILNHANDANLHKIIQQSFKIKTKIIFKQFMKEKLHIISAKPAADKETHEQLQPKLIARLANTLNLTCKAHSGSKHHDIDQPLS